MNSVKETDIKNCTHYFFDLNIKHFQLNKIKTDEKSYKNIFTYYISYVKASVPCHQ